MKERPILFSTEMVQAIMAGRKTQTRRVVKPQPEPVKDAPGRWKFLMKKNGRMQAGSNVETKDLNSKFFGILEFCPYGQPGDVLWVRETFCRLSPEHIITTPFVYKANADEESEEVRKEYINNGHAYRWKPSIHMPKKAARIWLRVKEVRVERIKQISEKDCQAEGAPLTPWEGINGDSGECYKYGFINIWNSIHGTGWTKYAWNSNPWVWVVEFEVLSTTGMPVEEESIFKPKSSPYYNQLQEMKEQIGHKR